MKYSTNFGGNNRKGKFLLRLKTISISWEQEQNGEQEQFSKSNGKSAKSGWGKSEQMEIWVRMKIKLFNIQLEIRRSVEKEWGRTNRENEKGEIMI